VGSCRREILDHVIALNEQHLRRLILDYLTMATALVVAAGDQQDLMPIN
jgi:hypothetical protein